MHLIENDGIIPQQTECTKICRQYRTKGNTNQDLVARPRYLHVYSDSRQSALRPELVCQFITSEQTQNFNEGGNFGNDPKIGVQGTSLVDNDVFSERVLPVSRNQRSPHYSLPLSLHISSFHGLPRLVQHFPVWRLQPQTLVAWKMLAALEVSQNLMVTMSKEQTRPYDKKQNQKWLGFVAISVVPVTKD